MKLLALRAQSRRRTRSHCTQPDRLVWSFIYFGHSYESSDDHTVLRVCFFTAEAHSSSGWFMGETLYTSCAVLVDARRPSIIPALYSRKGGNIQYERVDPRTIVA